MGRGSASHLHLVCDFGPGSRGSEDFSAPRQSSPSGALCFMMIWMSQEQQRDELVYVRGALYGALIPIHVFLIVFLFRGLQASDIEIFRWFLLIDFILTMAPFTFYPIYNVLKDLSQPTIIFLLIIFWSVVGMIFSVLLRNKSRLWRIVILTSAFIVYTALCLFFQYSFVPFFN